MENPSPLSRFMVTTVFGLAVLWVLYWLIDYHMNVMLGFSLREGFIIASEGIVAFAILMALLPIKKEQITEIEIHPISIEEFHDLLDRDSLKSSGIDSNLGTGCHHHNHKERKPKTGTKLAPIHKMHISQGLKKMYEEKRARKAAR